ncbi:MAG: hypothetical protein MJ240_06560 [Kiritimatiellae bacterium]|nr:hypothetical protein [Kiritimatiellia bacterium]
MKRIWTWGLIATAFVAGADTVYVDCNLPDYAGHDGSSWNKAFKTIQEGVDKAVTDDTVLVAPGWYDEGGTTLGSGDAYLTNRVTIAGKRITVKSKEGRATRDCTFIVGRHASVPEDPDGYGMGTDAIRCVRVDFADPVHGSVIEGFSLVNGATHYNGGNYAANSIGGGVNFGNRTTSSAKASYLVDCVVSNCVATRGGGIYFGNAVRTRFVDNAAPKNGTAVRDAHLYYCVLDGANKGSGGVAYLGGTKAVNCTIANAPIAAVRGNLNTDNTYGSFLNCAILHHVSGTAIHVVATNSVLASNCAYLWGDKAASGYSTNNCRSVEMTSHQFVSPATGDFRPLASGDLVGAGDAALLNVIPEAYRYTDYAGNAVPSSGPIVAGAITKAETPVGGAVYFSSVGYHGVNQCSLFVDGYEQCVDKLYSYGMSYPDVHRLDFVMPANPDKIARRHFFGCSQLYRTPGAGDSSTYAFPLRGTTTCYVMGPPANGTSEIIPQIAENAFWADPSIPDGAEMDGSETKPYNTLQGAMDAACAVKSFCMIYAKRGRYDKGGKFYGGLTNRVALTVAGTYVRLYAVDGPEHTFIVGKGDESSTHSHQYGDAAVRCFATCTSVAQVSGFTLTDGRVTLNNGSEEKGADGLYGGATWGNNNVFYYQVEDCVITNCAASRGAAAWRGILRRCRIEDCTSTRLGVLRGTVHASSCVFRNIKCLIQGDYVLGQDEIAYNCDFIDLADVKLRMMNNGAGTKLYNSVIYGNAYLPAVPLASIGGIFYDNCKTVEDSVKNRAGLVRAKMAFADAAAGDYALYSSSKAATGGNVNNVDADFWRYGSPLDIEGRPFEFGADGMMVAGAYQRQKPSVTVTVSGSDVTPTGEIFVTEEEPLSVSATAAETRNFQGFYLDGECLSTEAAYVYSYAAANAGQAFALEARYVPYWYVDPTASDANSGRDWAHAKRTLAGVMALVRPGDTVYAAPGVYDDGSMINPKNFLSYSTPRLRTRVFVTNNVALVSRDGAATTIIKGQNATSAIDGFGGGEDALRCVYLAQGARLEGFTLTDGRTLGENLDKPDDNNRGAGVHGWGDDAPEVRDCIITNCVAARGGGSVYVTAVNCRYLDNRATMLCAASQHTAHHNCYLDHNKGTPTVGYWRDMRNSTIGAHNDTATPVGTSPRSGVTQQPAMYNTLILAGRLASGSEVAFTNCAFTTDMLVGWPASATSNDTCVCVPPAMLQADAEGHPIVGCNLSIDQGNTNYVNWARCGAYDLDGNPRCVNGLKMDIGCFEADWRARYADDLGGRHLTVSEASPAVAETEARSVAMVDGTSLTLEMANPKARNTLQKVQFRVSGAGSLSLAVGGETLTYTAAAEVQTYAFRSREAMRELKFAFAGEGCAELLLGHMDVGMVLNIR